MRLTKNEASMCQFMHTSVSEKKRAELFSQVRLLVRQPGQPFSAGSDKPAFCGVQQPQNAKVDHWEVARRTMCILCILYPTRSNDYRNPPPIIGQSVNRSIGQSGSLYKYCSCCGTSHLFNTNTPRCRVQRNTSTFTFIIKPGR